jgi:hypothetical protein
MTARQARALFTCNPSLCMLDVVEMMIFTESEIIAGWGRLVVQGGGGQPRATKARPISGVESESQLDCISGVG